jgi:hypothetical protein
MLTGHKPCTIDGCNQSMYARGYCLSHYKKYYLLPKAIEKQKNNPKKKYNIPKRTKKREKEETIYHDERKEFIEEERQKDKLKRIFCIFCGEEIKGEPDLHHGDGRDNDKLLRKEDWFLSHHECHMDYHDKSWKKLKWWSGYIERISINFLIHKKELKKMEK